MLPESVSRNSFQKVLFESVEAALKDTKSLYLLILSGHEVFGFFYVQRGDQKGNQRRVMVSFARITSTISVIFPQ